MAVILCESITRLTGTFRWAIFLFCLAVFSRNRNNDLLQKYKIMMHHFAIDLAQIVAAIGYRTMCKGCTVVVAGTYNKLLVITSKVMPSVILNPLIQKMLA